jgi:hypothetical protein
VEQLLSLADEEERLSPLPLLAKSDNFFLTFVLPQVGQITFSADVLRTSFSNGSPQSVQSNSKIGMFLYLGVIGCFTIIFDAWPGKRLHAENRTQRSEHRIQS